ncbi:NADH-quinone oxidoreductase subunit C [Plantactinospora sp. GCM10030261]|uniref:NADH-quinone oxidoreductase subunit C n=1 Tax=Plantactinospora sp. GCM10030261 TaxID=3273420 RepID=UPI0036167460
MTPEEVGERLTALLGESAAEDTPVRAGVSGGGQAYARATVDVPVGAWSAALRAAREDTELSCDYFDWLSAVDELNDGFDVVAHLWSTRHRHGLLVRTRVPRDAPELPSVVEVYPGADWHERETHEMFGVRFTGRGELSPLLLPPEFEGHPLRKEFVLASRVAKPWPGAKEPGESEAGGARRQPMRPPGVPAPGEWGPDAPPGTIPGAAPAGRSARPARQPRADRPARPPRADRPDRPAPAASVSDQPEPPERRPAASVSDQPEPPVAPPADGVERP